MKMVAVIRKDLKMSKGKIAAQVAHAAIQCAKIAELKHKRWFDIWNSEGQKIVLLKIDDLSGLMSLEEKVRRAGLPAAIITDAGRTQLPPNTITCLGIGPAPDESIDKITGNLKLG